MAEFIRTEEKVVNVSEPVIFENNTDSDFSVSAAIVFRKSGLYDVSIVGRRTVVSKVGRTNTKERIGEWIKDDSDWFETMFKCSECGALVRKEDKFRSFFCYHCGADMRGEQDCTRTDEYEVGRFQQHGRIFQEIVVEYPSISVFPEYKGKPYFSIKYTENGQEFIGYGTYKPEVLSEYLKEYFMPYAQADR